MAGGVATTKVELKLSGAWTEVTDDVMLADGNRIVMKIGADSELSAPSHNTCQLTFKNTSRAYNPADPVGTHFGKIGIGTEIRVTSTSTVRFYGYVMEWKPGWDQSGNVATVKIVARSWTYVVSKDPAISSLKMMILLQTGSDTPIDYWPCDTGELTSFGSAKGGRSLSLSGTISGTLSSIPAAGSIPTFGTTVTVSGSIPSYTPGGTGVGSRFSFVYAVPVAGYGGARTVAEIQTSGQVPRLVLEYNASSQLRLVGYTAAGATAFTGSVTSNVNGALGYVDIRIRQNSGTPTSADYVLAYGAFNKTITGGGTSTVATTTAGAFTGFTIAPDANLDGTSAGHYVVFKTAATWWSAPTTALLGWGGEEADARMTRILPFRGGALTLADAGEPTELVGPQPSGNMISSIQAAALADGGILHDSFAAQATVRYASLRWLTSDAPISLVLQVNLGHISSPTQPLVDDKNVIMGATVSRPTGGSARYEPVAANPSVSLNPPLSTDARLMGYAEKLVAVGGSTDARIGSVTVDLAKNSSLRSTFLSALPGYVLFISGHPQAISPYDLYYYILGWTETHSWEDWDVDLYLVPARPYFIGYTLNNSWITGRLDSDGSTVNGSHNTTTTSLSVTVTGPVWTTSGSNFPFLMLASTGELLNVTAISGASSPQTFTVTRSVNSVVRSLPSGTVLTLWEPFRQAF